ncbi:hypothetical protein CC78DRAFT_530543 [Lojkania enalia]|uniref:Uncharacterized protein n=1 Tax=Lojkania enalia TaxID=147567 RepID=A0A9P4N921_9PLEO|nr:hypothetical protein CC78DRAFT_530543 [Didymosphaeria enalia]
MVSCFLSYIVDRISAATDAKSPTSSQNILAGRICLKKSYALGLPVVTLGKVSPAPPFYRRGSSPTSIDKGVIYDHVTRHVNCAHAELPFFSSASEPGKLYNPSRTCIEVNLQKHNLATQTNFSCRKVFLLLAAACTLAIERCWCVLRASFPLLCYYRHYRSVSGTED